MRTLNRCLLMCDYKDRQCCLIRLATSLPPSYPQGNRSRNLIAIYLIKFLVSQYLSRVATSGALSQSKICLMINAVGSGFSSPLIGLLRPLFFLTLLRLRAGEPRAHSAVAQRSDLVGVRSRV